MKEGSIGQRQAAARVQAASARALACFSATTKPITRGPECISRYICQIPHLQAVEGASFVERLLVSELAWQGSVALAHPAKVPS